MRGTFPQVIMSERVKSCTRLVLSDMLWNTIWCKTNIHSTLELIISDILTKRTVHGRFS